MNPFLNFVLFVVKKQPRHKEHKGNTARSSQSGYMRIVIKCKMRIRNFKNYPKNLAVFVNTLHCAE